MSKNMSSRSGITMMSLIIYITSFLVVTGIVAGITTFFYGNSTLMTEELYSSADHNTLNLYFVRESELVGNRLKTEAIDSINYAEFSNGDIFTYDTTNKILYYNSVCICEDVKGFEVKGDYSSGKQVVNVKIEFTNKSYSCKYTMAQ